MRFRAISSQKPGFWSVFERFRPRNRVSGVFSGDFISETGFLMCFRAISSQKPGFRSVFERFRFRNRVSNVFSGGVCIKTKLPAAPYGSAGSSPNHYLKDKTLGVADYIMPPMPPPMPGFIGGIGGLSSFFSATTHSVVRNMPAMEAAFSSAMRATLAGSTTPA